MCVRRKKKTSDGFCQYYVCLVYIAPSRFTNERANDDDDDGATTRDRSSSSMDARHARTHATHATRCARTYIYIHIFLTHIPHASRRSRRTAIDPSTNDPIRSTTRYPIAIVVGNPSSIHRSDVTRIIRTANKLNASRRLDASAALACTVVFAARVAACARRDLSAARAFSLAVKQEDKVTVDDITSAGMTHWANRAIVQSSTRSRPTPTPTHTVRGRDWWIVRARVSDIRHRRRRRRPARSPRGGVVVCVCTHGYTQTQSSSSSSSCTVIHRRHCDDARASRRGDARAWSLSSFANGGVCDCDDG